MLTLKSSLSCTIKSFTNLGLRIPIWTMTSTKLFLLLILNVIVCNSSKAQIIINEISNKNSGQIADEDNELDDWIELYNPSAEAINMAGYYLSDDSLNLEKWAVPSFQMPAGNHLTVFASSKNRILPPEALFDVTPGSLISSGPRSLHTNFKIDGKGEKIYLFNKTSNTLETVWVNNLSAGWSLGRVTDGANTWGVFIQPTPAQPNTTKAYSTDRETDPIFSVAEGFYAEKQTIRLSTTSLTAEIRYTMDGEEPTLTSTQYNGEPIVVTKTGLIRAICFSKVDKLPSRSVANTYFITTTGHSVPVLSIITNKSNLYGSTGIFDNTDKEWERSCYLEYFDKDNKKIFEQFSGIQVDGGDGGSRTNAQHSFRLEFDNNTFGEGKVDYPLIPALPNRKHYKSVYMRNGSSQWLNFEFKDAMECKMMSSQTNNYYSHCTPVVVYINGDYFGLYEMREKINDEYFEENYKATVDSTFHLLSLSHFYDSILRPLNGSVDTFTADYNRFMNLYPGSSDYLQKAEQILDLDYYTDYIIAESWIANVDWPHNNIKLVKGDFTNHKWRFILQDVEWGLDPNGWTTSNYDHIIYMITKGDENIYLSFWKQLMRNQIYRINFFNRFADTMNSFYLPLNTSAIAQSIYDDSYPEMRAEYVRWDGGDIQADNNMLEYESNLSIFKSELTNRSSVVRSNIVRDYRLTGTYTIELQVQPENAGVVQINTISPEVYPWTGVYFAGVPIKMEAKGMGDYVFDGWEPNSFITDVNNPVVEADVKVNGYTFIAKFKKIIPEQAITISEINFNSGEKFPASDWIELFNYGQTAINLTGWYLTDSDRTHKWTITGSVSILPNNRLVLASNKSKFNAVYPNVKNVIGSFEFGLGTPSDSLRLFDSNNKLIVGLQYNSEAPWPTDANGTGKTLELKDSGISLNLAANWIAGCEGGSPGTAYVKCSDDIDPSLEVGTAKLYPNPATDQVNIVLPSAINTQKVTCRIFNLMGKEIKAMEVMVGSQNRLIFSVTDFTKGIYIVQLTGDNYHQTMKFVKQ